jgi:transposase
MDWIRGQADLIYRHGSFFLHVIVDAPEPTPDEPTAYLSVDLGIRNVAADSDGQTYAGGHRKGLRGRCTGPRSRLQRKEHPFATNVNHFLSKRQVAKAKGTGRGIALEDLKGIGGRLSVKKAQRRSQHSWAFAQLRSFVE